MKLASLWFYSVLFKDQKYPSYTREKNAEYVWIQSLLTTSFFFFFTCSDFSSSPEAVCKALSLNILIPLEVSEKWNPHVSNSFALNS